jgi:thiol-disulfide isomerase/thioredoxin
MKHAQLLGVAALLFASGLAGFYISSRLDTHAVSSAAALPGTAMLDLHGATRTLDEWRGQPVLVNFWATWCPPCLKEIPLLVSLQEEFRDDGLAIVGVAVDEELAVRQFVAERELNFPVLLAEESGMGAAAALGADVFALPISAAVDRAGRVVFVRTGELTETMARDAIAEALHGE